MRVQHSLLVAPQFDYNFSKNTWVWNTVIEVDMCVIIPAHDILVFAGIELKAFLVHGAPGMFM